ncbi:hypothetical protein H8959_020215 [Pygathrix nigripes]
MLPAAEAETQGHDSGERRSFSQVPGLMQPFSIPVQITLQGSRRRQGRTAFPASGKKRETNCSDGDPLDVHKRLSSSAGED